MPLFFIDTRPYTTRRTLRGNTMFVHRASSSHLPTNQSVTRDRKPRITYGSILLLFNGTGRPLYIRANEPQIKGTIRLGRVPRTIRETLLIPIVRVRVIRRNPRNRHNLVNSRVRTIISPTTSRSRVLTILMNNRVAILSGLARFLRLKIVIMLFRGDKRTLPFHL